MDKILIVFAQHAEAKGTLELLNAVPVEGVTCDIHSEGILPSLYTFQRGLIALSSIGVHAAQMTVAKYAQHCSEVWNIGLAGCLNHRLPIGHVLYVKTVGKYHPLDIQELDSHSALMMQKITPPFLLDGKEGCLISSDFPIHDDTHRNKLATKWDVVDMEGYGIAFAASYLGKKCRMWKIVSDFASSGGRELIRTHKLELSERMGQHIHRELNHESSIDS